MTLPKWKGLSSSVRFVLDLICRSLWECSLINPRQICHKLLLFGLWIVNDRQGSGHSSCGMKDLELFLNTSTLPFVVRKSKYALVQTTTLFRCSSKQPTSPSQVSADLKRCCQYSTHITKNITDAPKLLRHISFAC